jgi:hypothetical protein
MLGDGLFETFQPEPIHGDVVVEERCPCSFRFAQRAIASEIEPWSRLARVADAGQLSHQAFGGIVGGVVVDDEDVEVARIVGLGGANREQAAQAPGQHVRPPASADRDREVDWARCDRRGELRPQRFLQHCVGGRATQHATELGTTQPSSGAHRVHRAVHRPAVGPQQQKHAVLVRM